METMLDHWFDLVAWLPEFIIRRLALTVIAALVSTKVYLGVGT